MSEPKEIKVSEEIKIESTEQVLSKLRELIPNEEIFAKVALGLSKIIKAGDDLEVTFEEFTVPAKKVKVSKPKKVKEPKQKELSLARDIKIVTLQDHSKEEKKKAKKTPVAKKKVVAKKKAIAKKKNK
jgi:hypothetical protein